MPSVRVFSEVPEQARSLDLEGFLAWLGGPALFHLRGRSSERCRVLCGGLHGNEPSGFYAIHELLKDPPELPVDALLLVGNVRAALYDVPFTHRFVPGEEDMNRVWDRRTGSALRAASGEVLDHLAGLPCESIVDLHNNTGHNPIYAVILSEDARSVSMGMAWTRQFVLYGGKNLGTLLEQIRETMPGVVIECGQAGDPKADMRALSGARHYLSAADPFDRSDRHGEVFAYRSVARIHVPDDVQLAFDEARTVADLTISPQIDQYNFEVMQPGFRLAWCNDRGRLLVIGNSGLDVTDDYLEVRDGAILLKREIVPVMMTTDGMAAKADCLLYAAERLQGFGER